MHRGIFWYTTTDREDTDVNRSDKEGKDNGDNHGGSPDGFMNDFIKIINTNFILSDLCFILVMNILNIGYFIANRTENGTAYNKNDKK